MSIYSSHSEKKGARVFINLKNLIRFLKFCADYQYVMIWNVYLHFGSCLSLCTYSSSIAKLMVVRSTTHLLFGKNFECNWVFSIFMQFSWSWFSRQDVISWRWIGVLGDFACRTHEGESVWNISVKNNYFKMHFKIYMCFHFITMLY